MLTTRLEFLPMMACYTKQKQKYGQGGTYNFLCSTRLFPFVVILISPSFSHTPPPPWTQAFCGPLGYHINIDTSVYY